jgi:hypothetical protein
MTARLETPSLVSFAAEARSLAAAQTGNLSTAVGLAVAIDTAAPSHASIAMTLVPRQAVLSDLRQRAPLSKQSFLGDVSAKFLQAGPLRHQSLLFSGPPSEMMLAISRVASFGSGASVQGHFRYLIDLSEESDLWFSQFTVGHSPPRVKYAQITEESPGLGAWPALAEPAFEGLRSVRDERVRTLLSEKKTTPPLAKDKFYSLYTLLTPDRTVPALWCYYRFINEVPGKKKRIVPEVDNFEAARDTSKFLLSLAGLV